MGTHAELVRVFAETRPDGCREFRRDEHDIETVEIWLEDYTGRRIPQTVHPSAVLLMVPVGPIGALVFEPALTDDGPYRDPVANRPVWIQRVILGHHEVADLVEKAVKTSGRPAHLIALPGGRG